MIGLILFFAGFAFLLLWTAGKEGEQHQAYIKKHPEYKGENAGCGLLVFAALMLYIAFYLTVILIRALSGDVI